MDSQTYELGLCDGVESLLVKRDNRIVAAYAQQRTPNGKMGTHPIGRCYCCAKPNTLNWTLCKSDVAMAKLVLLGILGVPVRCYTSGKHAVVFYIVKGGSRGTTTSRGLVFMCNAVPDMPVILAHRMHNVCVYNDHWAMDVLSRLDQTHMPTKMIVKRKDGKKYHEVEQSVNYVYTDADVDVNVYGKRPMPVLPLKLIKGIDLAVAIEPNIESTLKRQVVEKHLLLPARPQQLRSRLPEVFPENEDQQGSQSQLADVCPNTSSPQQGATGLQPPDVFPDDDYAFLCAQ